MTLKTTIFSSLAILMLTCCHDPNQGALQCQDMEHTITSLPFDIPEMDLVPLRSVRDENLETQLEAAMAANTKWDTLVRTKKMAVGVVDISDPYAIRFASLNGDEMMYAACLPKIAILLAAIDAFDKGELEESEELLADLNSMISHSSNTAATRFIDMLGYEKIESVLTDPRYELYDEQYGGGLWVGKRYASQGQRYPDPLEGLSHAATVTQVCRFYYLMAMGRLISPERSQQMLSLMDDPALHHKFVSTLDQIAPGVKLYRKSGTWMTFHCDSVLVWGKDWRRYILVALVDDPEGESIIRSLVRPVEDVLRSTSVK